MIECRFYFLCLCTILLVSFACSKVDEGSQKNGQGLMSGQDVLNNSYSNVTVSNGAHAAITSAGLFIASFDTNDCSSCFGGIVGGDNAGGSFVQQLSFAADQTIPIGQNFLYNMLYNGIYYIKNTAGTSPCQLPGCTWTGDDPNVKGWCISINAISRDSSYTFNSSYVNASNPPASVISYGAAGNSNPFNYKYDLFDPNTLGIGNACIGPIVCNDQTLTCTVSTSQDVRFKSY